MSGVRAAGAAEELDPVLVDRMALSILRARSGSKAKRTSVPRVWRRCFQDMASELLLMCRENGIAVALLPQEGADG